MKHITLILTALTLTAVISMPAVAGSLDPTNPVAITLPYASTVDTGNSTIGADNSNVPAPYDNCTTDAQSVFYTFTTPSVSSNVDFFAMGEDTEIRIARLSDGLGCEGGDDDDEPSFSSDLGLTAPAGWHGEEGNSEWFEQVTLDANTDYIVVVGHNSDSNDVSDCIAWGIAYSGNPTNYGSWVDESCPAASTSASSSSIPVPVDHPLFLILLALLTVGIAARRLQ